jgi:hypothetical protein
LIIWRGTSLIDGVTPIVCIMTGLDAKSANRKTGAMVQTYIIRSDVSPVTAAMSRDDVGICGGCVHRKQESGRRTCYVNLGQGPRSVYDAFTRNRYPVGTLQEAAAAVAGKFVRFGTYGDPAAVPAEVWATLAGASMGRTGYTHQWRNKKFSALAPLMQASCETAADVARAHALGFNGTFRVVPLGEVMLQVRNGERWRNALIAALAMALGMSRFTPTALARITISLHGRNRKYRKYINAVGGFPTASGADLLRSSRG